MKILLVTEDLPVAALGGAGKHAVLLGNTLLAAGHEVEMLGRLRAPGVEGNADFEGPLHCAIDLSGTGWQEYRFGAFVPYRREHAARRIWAAIRALGVERFDAIHYHGHVYALGAVVPAGVPFVSTLHDQGSECLTMTRFRHGAPCAEVDPAACAGCATAAPNTLQRWLSATAVARHRAQSAAAFARHETIFVSDFLRRRFEAHVQPTVPLRAQVVHNFTSSERIAALSSAAPAQAPADPRPVLLMAGRIDATKGFGALLDALDDAALARWQVRVVGSGPQWAELQARHAGRGVVFTGHVSQAQVYRETASASVCVVPSIWEEPCGTTVLEALALGKPVYALARGGTPELVRYERWPGQLVLESDLAGLARRLQAPPVAVSAPRALPAASAELADVRQRLPEILAVYARAGLRSAPARPRIEVTS
jgi:glycosyltransferase involved in cell wall biosynthesis